MLAGRRDRYPVLGASARQAAVGNEIHSRTDAPVGIWRERRLGIHVHHHEAFAIRQRNEAAVIGRSATDPNHRKWQRPTARLGAGAHVEPAERTGTVNRDAFERMVVASVPAVVL